MYNSTCFGRPHAHHQKLNKCSSSLWFYRWSVVVAVLLIVVGPVARPRSTADRGILFDSRRRQEVVFLLKASRSPLGHTGPLVSRAAGIIFPVLKRSAKEEVNNSIAEIKIRGVLPLFPHHLLPMCCNSMHRDIVTIYLYLLNNLHNLTFSV
jgi:hypothetical protein